MRKPEIIKKIRKQHKLNQETMAGILRVGQPTLSKIEKHSAKITADAWARFCGYFKLDVHGKPQALKLESLEKQVKELKEVLTLVADHNYISMIRYLEKRGVRTKNSGVSLLREVAKIALEE